MSHKYASLPKIDQEAGKGSTPVGAGNFFSRSKTHSDLFKILFQACSFICKKNFEDTPSKNAIQDATVIYGP